MTTALYAIFAILLFGLLVGIHEFGHIAVAKLCGMKVLEFALGMGPALLQKQGKETRYCDMMGEDEESSDPRAFTNQAPWKRALILVAGAAMNFLLGLVIVIILYSGAYAFRAPVIADFMEGCPYEGENILMTGDVFYSIDGKEYPNIFPEEGIMEKMLYKTDRKYNVRLHKKGYVFDRFAVTTCTIGFTLSIVIIIAAAIAAAVISDVL